VAAKDFLLPTAKQSVAVCRSGAADLEALLDKFEAWLFSSFRVAKMNRRTQRLKVLKLLDFLEYPTDRAHALGVQSEETRAYLMSPGRSTSFDTRYSSYVALSRFYGFCLRGSQLRGECAMETRCAYSQVTL